MVDVIDHSDPLEMKKNVLNSTAAKRLGISGLFAPAAVKANVRDQISTVQGGLSGGTTIQSQMATNQSFANVLGDAFSSFLGLGAPLNAPSWGNMLSDSRQYLVIAPWMMLVPAVTIVWSVISLNLIGDGIAELSRKRARAVEV